MENGDNRQNEGGHHHHNHMPMEHMPMMAIVLKLVIAIIIFWCGFKLGEITGTIRMHYGGTMMNSTWNGMMNGNNPSNTNGLMRPAY